MVRVHCLHCPENTPQELKALKNCKLHAKNILHRRSQGVHWVHDLGDLFARKSCKCTPRQRVHPRGRARVQFFKGNWGDLGGGRGYLGSFSVCFEGDD